MSAAVSPLAPKSVPTMPVIPGVKLGTAAAGIKYKNRTDVMLALFEPGTTVAGVFTTSKCPSAPVEWCRDRLSEILPMLDHLSPASAGGPDSEAWRAIGFAVVGFAAVIGFAAGGTGLVAIVVGFVVATGLVAIVVLLAACQDASAQSKPPPRAPAPAAPAASAPRTVPQPIAGVTPVQGDYTIKNFKFTSGEKLAEIRMHYMTYGTAKRDLAVKLNTNTVSVMTGSFGSTYAQIGADLG